MIARMKSLKGALVNVGRLAALLQKIRHVAESNTQCSAASSLKKEGWLGVQLKSEQSTAKHMHTA